MLKKILYSVILVFLVFQVQAQDVSFTAVAPKKIQVGEQFKITYTINDRVSDFKPPQFTDFIFLSSQKGVSTVNWNTSQQFIFFFKATQAGVFKVEPASARHKRETIESNALEIEVVTSSQSTQRGGQANSNPASAKPSGGVDVFIRLLLDKHTAYVGEQITGWVKVYTKLQLSGIGHDFQGPDYTGFYVQNVKTPPIRSLEPEKVGNETYYSGTIRKVILIPQKSGKITIEPFEVIVQHDKKVKIGHFTTYQTQNSSLTTKAITVNVKPLPGNKPAGFAGAIGDFNIKASISSNKIRTNDAVIFNVVVSGKGNLKLIDNINYNLPPALDVFDPVIKTKIDGSGLSGSKSFEITAIPRHAGRFNIKPFELVFYNLKNGSYSTRQTNSFQLTVEKGEGDSSAVVISNLSREDVELLESDIRYIKTETQLKAAKQYLIDKHIYYFAAIFCLIVFVSVLFLRREQIKRNNNIARTKHKKASRMAHKRFKNARRLLKENQVEKFYEELSKAIWGYISDKLSISLSELSSDMASDKLKFSGADSGTVDDLMVLISSCEFAKYAPGSIDKRPDELLSEAEKLLSGIEQKI